MQLFTCSNCGQIIYFENTRCERCGNAIGLIREGKQMVVLSAGGGYRYCANHAFDVCNWLVAVSTGSVFCEACELNRTIPNLQEPSYREYWSKIEMAKHRLIYSLIRLQLPFLSKLKQVESGLCFDLIADEKYKKVFTGHDNGLITINIAEADDIRREMARKNMNEAYRTVLGHFRHEIGHYYWDVLIRDSGQLESFRQLFGDERSDYEQALQRHYQDGAPTGWQEHYISAYASSHPWEDWAESWAHYMHIMDTLETAYSYNLRIRPWMILNENMAAAINHDPYEGQTFGQIMEYWLPLTYAMNSLNRSMGIEDLYPFIIVPDVVSKLSYIHAVCNR